MPLYSPSTGGASTDADVTVQTLGSPTIITTVRDFLHKGWSAGVVSGGDLTDNVDGTVDIAAGEIMLRPTADDGDDLVSCTFPLSENISLTDDSINYLYVDYNSGSPVVAVTTSSNDFNCLNKCHLFTVVRAGTILYVLEGRFQNKDSNRKHRRRLYKTDPFAHTQGGTVINNSGLYLTVTAGEFFYSLNPLSHGAYDTSVAGTANANVFDYYYDDGGTGFTKVADQKQINSTQYDDGDGALGTLTALYYGVHWVYLILHTTPRLAVVYGTGNYATLADAQAAGIPSALPQAIVGAGKLIGRAIIQKSNTTIDVIESAFDTSFSASGIPDHNNTGAKQGGTTGQYNHLTDAQIAALHSNSLDHTQGTDQGLDTGGDNAVTALQAKTAYLHSQAAHAPSNAQKNSDILKSEVEAVLTGEITSHTHPGGGGGLSSPQVLARSLGA